MTLRNDNLLTAAAGTQKLTFWLPIAASRPADGFGTGAAGCFVPSAASQFGYQPGQAIAPNYPAPPIVTAPCSQERCP